MFNNSADTVNNSIVLRIKLLFCYGHSFINILIMDPKCSVLECSKFNVNCVHRNKAHSALNLGGP